MVDQSETLEILVKLKNLAKQGLDSVDNSLEKVDKQGKKTNKSLLKLRKGISGLGKAAFSLKGALVGIGLGFIAKSFINAASTAEQYRTRLVTLLGSQKEANKLFDEMSDFASSVSYSYEEIMGSATNLAAVVKGGTEEVGEYMPMIADLAAASGLGIQETTGQVIRMYSAGAAAADMFRERGVLAMLGFQAGVSYTAEETKKMMSAAFEDPASKFAGAASALALTWDGMLSMMGDAWFQFRNAVMESGVFDWMKAALNLVLEYINDMKESGDFSSFAKSIGEHVVGALEKVLYVVALVGDAFRGWGMIWTVLRNGFARFAQGLNTGLSAVGKVVDWINEKLSGVKTNEQEFYKENAEYWKQVVVESNKVLQSYAGQESLLGRVEGLLTKIRNRAAQYAEKAKEATDNLRGEKAAPEASFEKRMASEVARLKEGSKTALAILKNQYDQGIVGLQEYYDKRYDTMLQNFEKERQLLQSKADLEVNPDKKLALQDKIFAMEQNHQRALLALSMDRKSAQEAAEMDILNTKILMTDLRVRGAEDERSRMLAVFEQEQVDLQLKHENELLELENLKAGEHQINEAYRLQELEKEKLFADQKKRIQEMAFQGVKTTLGYMEQAFGDMYAASGEKAKEYFYAQKAVQIAQTIMSTYSTAQKAYESLANIPYVGNALGIAAAAAAIASGLARVNAIRSQKLAEGGEVGGYSPTKTSDNIHADLTAGEYVHPVDTVKHYGLGIMQALKDRVIPKELLAGFGVPNIGRIRPSYAYATGGAVSAQKSIDARDSEQPPINVVNMVDPQMMDEYLASTTGERTLLNVLSRNNYQVQRVLGLGGI